MKPFTQQSQSPVQAAHHNNSVKRTDPVHTGAKVKLMS